MEDGVWRPRLPHVLTALRADGLPHSALNFESTQIQRHKRARARRVLARVSGIEAGEPVRVVSVAKSSSGLRLPAETLPKRHAPTPHRPLRLPEAPAARCGKPAGMQRALATGHRTACGKPAGGRRVLAKPRRPPGGSALAREGCSRKRPAPRQGSRCVPFRSLSPRPAFASLRRRSRNATPRLPTDH